VSKSEGFFNNKILFLALIGVVGFAALLLGYAVIIILLAAFGF
jgi:hypothetical protein